MGQATAVKAFTVDHTCGSETPPAAEMLLVRGLDGPAGYTDDGRVRRVFHAFGPPGEFVPVLFECVVEPPLDDVHVVWEIEHCKVDGGGRWRYRAPRMMVQTNN